VELKSDMKSFPLTESQKNHYAKVLIWLILIVIIVSGVMYLVYKVNERNALHASLEARKQKTNLSSNDAAADSKHVLQVLRAQGLVGQSIYKTKIWLPDATVDATASQRDGLWQPGQQQLVMVDVTVRIAVDLSELKTQSINHKKPQSISLPRPRIVAVQVDNVTGYDLKTRQPSIVQLGVSSSNTQSQSIKQQIQNDVCTTGMLKMATEASRQHVVALLDSMHTPMIVEQTDNQCPKVLITDAVFSK
jgi:Protein of unknown function (DUF4230)